MEELEEASGSDPVTHTHRSRAAYLYGLIVSGAVLAAAPDHYTFVHVILVLVGTLLIYWAAETYAHLLATRANLHRVLTGAERRHIAREGWPLVASCAIPLLVLVAEAILGVDSKVAVDVTLGVNTILLFLVGLSMSRSAGLTGVRLWMSAAASGLLGLLLIVLKGALH